MRGARLTIFAESALAEDSTRHSKLVTFTISFLATRTLALAASSM